MSYHYSAVCPESVSVEAGPPTRGASPTEERKRCLVGQESGGGGGKRRETSSGKRDGTKETEEKSDDNPQSEMHKIPVILAIKDHRLSWHNATRKSALLDRQPPRTSRPRRGPFARRTPGSAMPSSPS